MSCLILLRKLNLETGYNKIKKTNYIPMKKINYIHTLLLGAVLIFSACKKDEISSFTAAEAVNFTTTLVEYSFLGNPETEYIQTVPVRIIGQPSDHDRKFKVEVVNDSITTATSDQYRIIEGLVKAGEYTGELKVALLNSAVLNTKKVALKLKLSDSESFKAGNVENSEFVINWTNQILVPNWSYYRYFFTSAASTNAYRIIVQVTGIKSLTAAQFRALGQIALETQGTKFGDYVKQWNKDHPNDRLKHDSGTLIGQDIVPLYYTKSKFD